LSAAVAGVSAAAQYLRLKAAGVVNHFAAKYTTDEQLEPVPDTEDHLKIRAYVVLSLSIPP
jgi:hypothetical protein